MLRDRTGTLSLSTTAMDSFMDSIGSRLDEAPVSYTHLTLPTSDLV